MIQQTHDRNHSAGPDLPGFHVTLLVDLAGTRHEPEGIAHDEEATLQKFPVRHWHPLAFRATQHPARLQVVDRGYDLTNAEKVMESMMGRGLNRENHGRTT